MTRAGLMSNAGFVVFWPLPTDHWPLFLNRLALHLRDNLGFLVRDRLLMRPRPQHFFHADVFADVRQIRSSRGFLRSNFERGRSIFGLLQFSSLRLFGR